MSSPAPSTTSATDPHAASKTQEQITFRFCRECSNMLYPKEDRMTNKLMFACRTCQFSEEAQSSCVFRNNMYNTVGETAGVTQDVGSDPTVGSFHSEEFYCTLCGREMEGSCKEEEEEERMEEDDEGETDIGGQGEKSEKENGVKVTVFDLSEIRRMEEEEQDEEAEHYTLHNEVANPEAAMEDSHHNNNPQPQPS